MNYILYTIRPGDTLYNLAMKYNTTVQDILNTNSGLSPYNLRVGSQIYIYPNTNVSNCISPNEVNLIKKMNLVWEQHIMWTRMLLISIAESLVDLDATRARLLQIPEDIADVFEKFYGSDIAESIQRLLTEHLEIGEKIIFALKNNNTKLADELNTKWYKNADEMAEAFSSINPYYNKEDVRKMFYEHLKLTTDEVTARIRKDYKADIKAYDTVQKEILAMSQYFVDGIVRQFPNLF